MKDAFFLNRESFCVHYVERFAPELEFVMDLVEWRRI